jgi:hypothetical protein
VINHDVTRYSLWQVVVFIFSTGCSGTAKQRTPCGYELVRFPIYESHTSTILFNTTPSTTICPNVVRTCRLRVSSTQLESTLNMEASSKAVRFTSPLHRRCSALRIISFMIGSVHRVRWVLPAAGQIQFVSINHALKK